MDAPLRFAFGDSEQFDRGRVLGGIPLSNKKVFDTCSGIVRLGVFFMAIEDIPTIFGINSDCPVISTLHAPN